MKKKFEREEFDAVGFQRERRNALSNLMNESPAAFEKQLNEVRKKYEKLFKTKRKKAA